MIFRDVGTVMTVWLVRRNDPGFIYILESHGRYKIGKTTSAKDRLKAAKTWLPDMTLIGFKPFWGMSHHERLLHTGFARYWYSGEWYSFGGDDDARDTLLEGFCDFCDEDPDANSVDFVYWYNGEGMIEFQMEMHHRRLTLPKFQRQESDGQRKA